MKFFPSHSNTIIFSLLVSIIFIKCPMNLISPGVTSNYRLTKLGATNSFEESIIHGQNYDVSAFFIKPAYLPAILSDRNNLFRDTEEYKNLYNFILSAHEDKTLILCEVCFDLEKDINDAALEKYIFLLNNQKPTFIFRYTYPYSYYMYGTTRKRYTPMISSQKDLEMQKHILAIYDYVDCERYVLEYRKSEQREGNNKLRIVTPRNNYVDFAYEFHHKFVEYWKEEIEMGIRAGVR